MSTKYLTQDCGCVINLYPDGCLGGAEMGERCSLHWAARDLLAALEAFTADYAAGIDFTPSVLRKHDKLMRAAIAKATKQ